jgi:hypothetical protein
MSKVTPCDRFEREGALRFEQGSSDEHLDSCVDCRAARQKLLRVADALHDAHMTVSPRAGWEARVFHRIERPREVRHARVRLPVVAAYAGMAAVLVSALYVSAGRAPTVATVTRECPAVSALPPASPPTPPAAALRPAALAPVDASRRRIKVIIRPVDASVAVEGRRTPLKNGLLEIEGRLGSVHRVGVSKGSSQVDTEVVISDNGPFPPLIELLNKASAGASGQGSTAPTSTLRTHRIMAGDSFD